MFCVFEENKSSSSWVLRPGTVGDRPPASGVPVPTPAQMVGAGAPSLISRWSFVHWYKKLDGPSDA